MSSMIALLMSVFKRVTTAITSPFRMTIVQIQRLFNINVITAKLISPLTKSVKELLKLRPKNKDEYYTFGRMLIYKKVFLTGTLIVCAGVFLFFTMVLDPIPEQQEEAQELITNIYYDFDDMSVNEFSGTANIRANDGQVVYIGEVDKGVCTGTGKLYDRNGRLLYEGSFAENKYNGEGVKYYTDGTVLYTGGFVNNEYEGLGILYDLEGKVLYEGNFVSGEFEGEGKIYSNETLMYAGGFSKGDYQGVGVLYNTNGNVKYEGEFFGGKAQGLGTMYSTAGKALYTGPMYGDEINYKALLGNTLADIDSAFTETPKIYYSEIDSCFVYEEAGVIISTDCKIMVDVWEKTQSEENTGEGYFYMPDSQVSEDDILGFNGEGLPDGMPIFNDGSESQTSSEDYPIGNMPIVTDDTLPPTEQPPIMLSFTHPSGDVEVLKTNAELIPMSEMPNEYKLKQTAFVPPSSDDDDDEDLSAAQEEQREYEESLNKALEDYIDQIEEDKQESDDAIQSYLDAIAELQEEANEEAKKLAEQENEPDVPDFVDKNVTLYFEVDTDIWQSEEELDRTKVFVEKVTVLKDEESDILSEDAVAYDENLPPTVEDCVSIDYIRQDNPTAFSNISYEMDRQNKLFIELSRINYAQRIVQKAYLDDGYTYIFNYQLDDANQVMYYSVEK